MMRLPSGDAVMPCVPRGIGTVPICLRRGEVEHGDERLVVLVRDIGFTAVGQHGEPMARAFVIDRVDDAPGLAVDDENLAVELRGDVDHAARVDLHAVRRAIRRKVDDIGDFALGEVEHVELVTRLGIAVVDAGAVNRHVREAVIGRQRKVVWVLRQLEARALSERRGIEEPHVAAELVDEQHTLRARRVIETLAGRRLAQPRAQELLRSIEAWSSPEANGRVLPLS